MHNFMYLNGDFTEDECHEWHYFLEDEASQFNSESEHVNVYLLTSGGLAHSFQSDILKDL